LQAAHTRGLTEGRRRKMADKQVRMTAKLLADPQRSVTEICQTFGVNKSTIYRNVKALQTP
jgi:transposase-like protein